MELVIQQLSHWTIRNPQCPSGCNFAEAIVLYCINLIKISDDYYCDCLKKKNCILHKTAKARGLIYLQRSKVCQILNE